MIQTTELIENGAVIIYRLAWGIPMDIFEKAVPFANILIKSCQMEAAYFLYYLDLQGFNILICK